MNQTNPQGMMMNNTHQFNNMMQGMSQMNMGGGGHQPASPDNGFGAPMGGGQKQSQKEDPFSSLGGMNAFR